MHFRTGQTERTLALYARTVKSDMLSKVKQNNTGACQTCEATSTTMAKTAYFVIARSFDEKQKAHEEHF